MRISYRSNLDGIGVEQLSEHFFDGWPNPPSKTTFLRLLEQSYAAELAVDDETGKVIGFIQAFRMGCLVHTFHCWKWCRSSKVRGLGRR